MNLEFVRDAGSSFLRIAAEDNVEDFQMRMIEENQIEGLLSVAERNLNGRRYYMYEISSLLSFEVYNEGNEIKYEFLMALINGLKMIFVNLEKYLLDFDGLLLEPSMIFISSDMKKVRFAYCVRENSNFEENMQRLFEYVIKKIDHKDSRAVAIAYGVFKRVCDGNINVDTLFEFEETKEERCEVIEERQEIKEILPEIVEAEEEVTDKTKMYTIIGAFIILAMVFLYFFASAFIQSLRPGGLNPSGSIAICIIIGAAGYYGYKWYIKNKDSFVKITKVSKKIPYEKSNVRIIVPRHREEQKADEGTVLLNDVRKETAHALKWEYNGDSRRYSIDGEVTIIGSAEDKSDCIISVPGVSRMHAKISKVGDEYFIKDLNSTNGTFVNGRELNSFEMCRIKRNDHIIVGNIECVFV